MEQKTYIFTISKMFLSFTPLHKIKNFMQNNKIKFDVDLQKCILENTVLHPLNRKFLLKKSYQKLFLKFIIQQLDSQNEEILDELYNEYCNILSQDETTQLHFRHFILDDNSDSNYITIQESINMISQGTTGLCSWQAASVLSEWCIENKEKLEGKVILELGSGVGLLGLSVIQKCSPRQYIFTDGHVKVLSMLCKNIATNFSNNNASINNFDMNDKWNLHLERSNTDIEVKHLLWEDIEKWILEADIAPDIILAADILFDSNVFPSLVCGLKAVLSLHKIQGYIAATVRNETTIDDFLKQLDKYKISYKDEDTPTRKIFTHDEDTPVRIIQIS